MLGDYAVGKTCLVKRYILNTFYKNYKSSLGVDISSERINLDRNEINLQIWDKSEQTEFHKIRAHYIKGSDGGIIVFDLTRPESLDTVKSWIKEVHETVPQLPLVLVGNKADRVEERAVLVDEAKSLVKEDDLLFYIETSAKSGENVKSLFQEIAKRIIEIYDTKNHKKLHKSYRFKTLPIQALRFHIIMFF